MSIRNKIILITKLKIGSFVLLINCIILLVIQMAHTSNSLNSLIFLMSFWLTFPILSTSLFFFLFKLLIFIRVLNQVSIVFIYIYSRIVNDLLRIIINDHTRYKAAAIILIVITSQIAWVVIMIVLYDAYITDPVLSGIVLVQEIIT